MKKIERKNSRIFEQIAEMRADDAVRTVVTRIVFTLFFMLAMLSCYINGVEAAPGQHNGKLKPNINVFVLSLDGVHFLKATDDREVDDDFGEFEEKRGKEKKNQGDERRFLNEIVSGYANRYFDDDEEDKEEREDEEEKSENHEKLVRRHPDYGYSRREGEDYGSRGEKRKNYNDYYASNSSGYTNENDEEELMPHLRQAYEKFEDFQRRLKKLGHVRPKWKNTTKLLCAKIFEYLEPLTENSRNPVTIKLGKNQTGRRETNSEVKEYAVLLRNRRVQLDIEAVIRIAKEGKLMENDKRAFIFDEKKHVKKVAAITKELLEKYESLRNNLLRKYPTLTAAWLPSIADLGNST